MSYIQELQSKLLSKKRFVTNLKHPDGFSNQVLIAAAVKELEELATKQNETTFIFVSEGLVEDVIGATSYQVIDKDCLEGGQCPICSADLDDPDSMICPDCGFDWDGDDSYENIIRHIKTMEAESA